MGQCRRAGQALVLAGWVLGCVHRPPLPIDGADGAVAADLAADRGPPAPASDASSGDREVPDGGPRAPSVACARAFHPNGYQIPAGVAVDEHGHVLVAGKFAGTFAFDATVLAGADGGLFVVELGTDCAVVWARAFGTLATPQLVVAGIAARPGGGAVLVGQMQGSVDFGTGKLGNTSAINGSWALALDDGGRTIWARAFSDPQTTLYLTSVAVSPSDGSAVATGTLWGGTAALTPGVGHVELLDLDDSGGLLWSEALDSAHEESGRAVAVGSHGTIALGGYQDGTFSEDLSTTEPLVATFAQRGDLRWWIGGSRDGSSSTSGRETSGVGVTADGTIVAAGVGPPPGFPDSLPASSPGFFLAALAAADGSVVWSRASHGSAVFPTALAVSGDTIGVVGDGYADFDFTSLETASPGASRLWCFVAGFALDGVTRFTFPIQSTAPGIPLPAGIAGDGHGGFAVAGSFAGTLTLGGPLVAQGDVNDLYVVRLVP